MTDFIYNLDYETVAMVLIFVSFVIYLFRQRSFDVVTDLVKEVVADAEEDIKNNKDLYVDRVYEKIPKKFRALVTKKVISKLIDEALEIES